MLDILVPKIVGNANTFIVHAYKGIGHIPKRMTNPRDASKRILLENLPKLLKGYGKTFAGYSPDYLCAVVVVCDLDDKCLKEFRQALLEILDSCYPKPLTRFCIAVEESEAWLLGDLEAVISAYPNADQTILVAYRNDSICGTWETLARAIYGKKYFISPRKRQKNIVATKSIWAEDIAPNMNIMSNLSPSFCYFVRKMQELMSQ
jgi:hypothetical protein